MSELKPPTLDHGVIGNGKVLALVSPTSAIEWLCMPRFDSGSVFASILDAERGGCFRVCHASGPCRGTLRYVRNTNVTRTYFERGDDAWEVIDFAPRVVGGVTPMGLMADTPSEIVRIIQPLRGRPKVRIELDPRLDYARGPTELLRVGACIEARGTVGTLVVHTNADLEAVLEGQEIGLELPLFFSIAWAKPESVRDLEGAFASYASTVAGWRAWAQTCALPPFRPELVLRSALCLKLHIFNDTGAIIAATTTSIPEAMGTERTWDYRFCWLRDAAFVAEALRRLSHLREGERFLRFLSAAAESGPLQPLYRVDGGRGMPEEKLAHLAGFGGNGHVRIGNAAAEQKQNDLMGELVLCMETLLGDPRISHDDEQSFYPLVRRLVEESIVAADQPDTSIWEFRSLLRPYTFSRAMCAVAIERGALLARRLGHDTDAARWQAIGVQEREITLRRGYSAEHGHFTQALDGKYADASLLLLPSIGLIDAGDPRFLSTLESYGRQLVRSGLMQRYANEDDFGDTTSAFTICSFWWAEALALAGKLDDAIAVFDHVARFANPVGLFSEDIDPASGALLGNFPQAYTHVGLIHAATTIGTLLSVRDKRVRAWV